MSPEVAPPTETNTSDYRAPSFSWASFNTAVLFMHYLEPHSPLGLELVDHSVTPRKEDNPYGEIEAASIIVKGVLVPFFLSTQVFNHRPFFPGTETFESFSMDLPSPGQMSWDGYKGSGQRRGDNQDGEMKCIAGRGDAGKWHFVAYEMRSWDQYGMTGGALDVVDPQAYQATEYTALLVAMGSLGHCYFLVLEKFEGDGPGVFRRVGYLDMPRGGLKWLSWLTKENIKLV
jgi:hypothetical protein